MNKAFLFLSTLLFLPFINYAQNVRFPANFNKLNVASAFTVKLQQAESNKIEINGIDDAQLENISTQVKDNTLYIYANKKIVTKTTIKIVVSFVVLDELTVSGASTLYNKEKILFNNFVLITSGASDVDLNANFTQLTTVVSGASKLKLNGNAPKFNLKSSGASDVTAGSFETNATEIEISGASNVTVNTTDNISGEISGASDVKITGNPTNHSIKLSGAASISPSKYAQEKNQNTSSRYYYNDDVNIKITVNNLKQNFSKNWTNAECNKTECNFNIPYYKAGLAFKTGSNKVFENTGNKSLAVKLGLEKICTTQCEINVVKK